MQDPKVWSLENAMRLAASMADPLQNRLALAALTTHEPHSILISRNSTLSNTQSFNIKIPFEGAPITNQNHSGRCWLFAATNVFRVAVMRKYNLKKFELSQSYLFYWDKLEKANWFLEQIVDTAKEDLDGREVQALLDAPVGDGGQWDMVAVGQASPTSTSPAVGVARGIN